MTQDQADKMVSYALYRNSDKGDVKGLQLNVSARFFNDFNITANYAYTHARSLGASDGSADVAAWEPLDRSIRHAATIAANYHHVWGKYAMNVNVNGRLQSRTCYPDYEDAPGYGVWNINTTHTLDLVKWAIIEPSIGIDNIFDRVDRRIDSTNRKYALFTPGRMLVVGLKLKIK